MDLNDGMDKLVLWNVTLILVDQNFRARILQIQLPFVGCIVGNY